MRRVKYQVTALILIRVRGFTRVTPRCYPDGMAKTRQDEDYLEFAEGELEQAVTHMNDLGMVLEPAERIRLANTYALMSIARSLRHLAGQVEVEVR